MVKHVFGNCLEPLFPFLDMKFCSWDEINSNHNLHIKDLTNLFIKAIGEVEKNGKVEGGQENIEGEKIKSASIAERRRMEEENCKTIIRFGTVKSIINQS